MVASPALGPSSALFPLIPARKTKEWLERDGKHGIHPQVRLNFKLGFVAAFPPFPLPPPIQIPALKNSLDRPKVGFEGWKKIPAPRKRGEKKKGVLSSVKLEAEP